jgi:uncharacterized protein YkwD
MWKSLLSIILIALWVYPSYALGTLKPSLTAQIKRQEHIDKKNLIQERQAKNLARLANIRASRGVKKSSIKTSAPIVIEHPPVIQNPTSPAPKTWSNQAFQPSKIPGVDIAKVRDTWFGWYNDYRKSLNLGAYGYDSRLDATAHDWNIRFAEGKWQNHHTRSPWDGYYNFPVIDQWFKDRGIDPKVINRSKHTENVGYGYYSCSVSDCTDSLITSIRSTFDFFMSEKGKSYDAHYRSIVNPYFTKMGFDIITVPGENRYYITVHYITE